MEATMMNNQFLTPNLYTTISDVEIIDCLVDFGYMPKDFNQNQVISFVKDENFYLVLFMMTDDGQKGFLMYEILDFTMHVQELYMMSHLFKSLVASNKNNYTYRKAQYKLEEMLGMVPTFRALYKKTFDTDDYTMAA
ncbi:hypothetical protein [Flectobacillus major]|jgi:hypothetical protein|uniref:hypothetical protein n=1 Tax=Flectobacillus major TaxID=103 RepID=UPI0011829DFC|nr:hypothetical protein [Flectobacillus major]